MNRTRTPCRLAQRVGQYVGLRVGLVVWPLVASLALAGCSGDDPTPKIAPTETSTPTVIDTPDATPTEPAAALTPEQTVRAWVEARNAALQSGDTAAVEALSADECTTCKRVIDPIRLIYENGGHFDTKGWRVVNSRLRPREGGKTVVDTAVAIAGGETVSEAGADPVTYPAEKSIVVFRLDERDSRWVVRFVGFLS